MGRHSGEFDEMEQREVLRIVSEGIKDGLSHFDQAKGGNNLAYDSHRRHHEPKGDGRVWCKAEADEENGTEEEERAREGDLEDAA